LEFR